MTVVNIKDVTVFSMAEKEKSNWLHALSLLGQLGYIIAIPLVTLALGGRFLDKRYNTSPLLLIIGMFLALVMSTAWIYKKTMEIMKNTVDSADKNEPNKAGKRRDNDALGA